MADVANRVSLPKVASAPEETRKDLVNDPVLGALDKGRVLLAVAGKQGTSNVLAMLLDQFLVTSSLTGRQDFHNPVTPMALDLVPEAIVPFVESGFLWLDRGLALGLISETELERVLQNPEVLQKMADRVSASLTKTKS